jgi:hypothetical protein
MLSPHHVTDAYRKARDACRMEMDGERLPSGALSKPARRDPKVIAYKLGAFVIDGVLRGAAATARSSRPR